MGKVDVCIVGEFPPPPGGMAIQAELLFESLRVSGVKVSKVPTYSAASTPTLLKFISLNLRLIPAVLSAKTIHVFSHSYLSFFLFTLPPFLFAKLFGRKVVINYHGGSAGAFLDSSPLAKKILKAADAVVVPSGYLKAVFKERGIESRIVPNICNIARFQLRLREKPEPKIIVARHLEPVYNVACAIRAFRIVSAKFPAATLFIAGAGSEEPELRKLTLSLGLGSSVRFLGNIRNEDMAAVYQQADIFLNSSNVDNLPVAILEAFACGLAVVSTTAGGIPYLVEHEKTGLLAEVGDADSLAANILRLLEEPGLAHYLSKYAHSMLGQFDRDAVAKQWLELYSK